MANQQQGQQQRQDRDMGRGDDKQFARQDDATRGSQSDDSRDEGMRGDDTRKM